MTTAVAPAPPLAAELAPRLAELDAALARAAEAPARQLARTLALPVKQLADAVSKATSARDFRPVGAQALALVAAVHAAVDNLRAHTDAAAQGPVERLRADLRPLLEAAAQSAPRLGPSAEADPPLPALAAMVADRLAAAAGQSPEARLALSGAVAASGWLTLVDEAVRCRSVRFDVYAIERDRRLPVEPQARATGDDGPSVVASMAGVMPSLALTAPAVLAEHRRQLRVYAGRAARMTATHALWRLGCAPRDVEVLVRQTDDAATAHVSHDLATAFLVADAPSLPLYPAALVPAMRAFCLARLGAALGKDAQPSAKRAKPDAALPFDTSADAAAPCAHTLASAWTWACRQKRRTDGARYPRVVALSVVEWVAMQADWEAACSQQAWVGHPGAAPHLHRAADERQRLSVRLFPSCLRAVLVGAAWTAVLREANAAIVLSPFMLARLSLVRSAAARLAYVPPRDGPEARAPLGAVDGVATSGNPTILGSDAVVDPRFNDPDAASDVDEDELVGQSMLDPPLGFGVPTTEELERLKHQADEFARYLTAAARVEFASERWDPASEYFAPIAE